MPGPVKLASIGRRSRCIRSSKPCIRPPDPVDSGLVPLEAMTGSSGSGHRFRCKRSQIPLHSVAASTGNCAVCTASDRRFHWKLSSLPLHSAAASTASDRRFHWKLWPLPLETAAASTGTCRQMQRKPASLPPGRAPLPAPPKRILPDLSFSRNLVPYPCGVGLIPH